MELKVYSIVGLIPLFANQVLEPEVLQLLPEFSARMQWFLEHRPKLAGLISNWHIAGQGDRRLAVAAARPPPEGVAAPDAR